MPHILEPIKFPLHGTRLIEASAGTGKTYTIAALYLRLILGHGEENGFGRPLTPPEILVVTFTHAATEELRDRIRNRLTEAAAFFRGQKNGDEFLTSLCQEYDDEQLPRCAGLLDQAAQWMDEAAIYTIHAWCQRMLRQHAFESGSLFDLELSPDDGDLLEEAACDYWRYHFYPKSAAMLAEIQNEVKITTPQTLLAKIRPLLREGVKPDRNPFELMETRMEAIEEARRVWELDFDTAAKLVQKAQADKSLNGNKYRKASLEKWLEQFSSWIFKNAPLPEEMALQKLSTQGLKAGVSKKGVPPQHPAYEACDRLMERLAEFDIETALLSHGAGEIMERVAMEKKRLARIGFDDLLTRLGDALNGPGGESLAATISSQFPIAMIDEFQDTDPVQYGSFGKVYLGREGTGFFMIGDPKQAIYAFRGADIQTYLTARRDAEDRLYTLGKNYRSTKGVVKAVNRLFSAADLHPQGPFLFKEEIPFDKVQAQGRDECFMVQEKPVPGMTIWQMEQTEPVKKNGDNGYLDSMARAAAGEIARLLNLGSQESPQAGFQDADGSMTPLGPSDIAVLVRNRTEAQAIRLALKHLKVRTVYLSDNESVFDTEEARSIFYLLIACLDPSDEKHLRTALATPLLNLSLDQMDRFTQDESAWEKEMEHFRELRSIWQSRGVLPMLTQLFRKFDVPNRLMASSSGERTLTNLLHLAEMLQTVAAELEGDQALIRWLARQIMEPGNLADEQILRLESDDALVRIVTIHKSKGLEYPLVFLPFICSVRRVTPKNSPVLFLPDKNGMRKMVQKPGEEELAFADQERLAEDLRILYVAVTRARHACWLGVGVLGKVTKKDGETSDLHHSGLGYLLAGGKVIPTLELSKHLARVKGESQDIAVLPMPGAGLEAYQPGKTNVEFLPARKFQGRIPEKWWITSYSGILSGAALAPPIATPMAEQMIGPMIGPMIESVQLEGDAGKAAIEDDSGWNSAVWNSVTGDNLEPQALPDSPDSAAQDQLQEAVTADFAFEEPEISPWARSIHNFPRGPEPGTFLHDILEWAAMQGFDHLARDIEPIQNHIREVAGRRGWEEWVDVLCNWYSGLVETRLNLFDGAAANDNPDGNDDNGGMAMALAELPRKECRAELEFMFAAHRVKTQVLDNLVTRAILPKIHRPMLRKDVINGMLKGFIDLVFCHHGRYYVLDYKSNHLGDDVSAYGREAMAKAMLEHRYDLQYVLYTLALHRLLKSRLADYDYQRDVGGAVYLFLRGVAPDGRGVFVDKPPWALIRTLDHLFAGKEALHDC